jgi:aspartate dehydrogenase
MEVLRMKPLFLGFGNAANVILKELEGYIQDFYYFDEKNVASSNGKKLEKFLIPNDCSFVVECASVEAVKEYYRDIIISNKDFYILSTGAFADENFRNEFFRLLKNSTSKIYIPSGAIGGIDVINAIKEYIEKVVLRTRKPPKAFSRDDKEKMLIFSGDSIEAIKRFPKNTNVSVTLALSVGDFRKVHVEIYSDPKVEKNIHEVEVVSSVGNYKFIFSNNPSNNPKTSLLAPLSLAALIKKNFENVKIGG